MISRCDQLAQGMALCISRPLREIAAYRDEMTAIGVAQSHRTNMQLGTAGAVGLFLMALVALYVARIFTRPLVEITRSVDALALGRFAVPIEQTNRSDEIGRIARALSRMRDKLEERDRLRAEFARIDAINQRRHLLSEALARYESRFGDTTQKHEQTAAALNMISATLAEARKAAELECLRIAASSVAAASSAQLVSSATLQISDGISEISQRSRATRAALDAGTAEISTAGVALYAARGIADRAGAETEALREAVSVMASRLLRLAQHTSDSPDAKGERALALVDITAQTQAAALQISHELVALDGIMQDTSAILERSQEELLAARTAAGDVVVTAAEQGAATREIAAGLSKAAESLSELTNSVDALQDNLLGAQEATGQFSQIARQMIADAELIDAGIRAHLRAEVA